MRTVYNRRPAKAILAEFAAILDEVTTIKWGFTPTAGGKAVRFFTSAEFPIRIFPTVEGEKPRKHGAPAPGDVHIFVQKPATFPSVTAWKVAVRSIIRTRLLNTTTPPPQVAAALAVIPRDDYAAACEESARSWAEFRGKFGPNLPPAVNLYLEDCEKFPLQ